MNKDSNDTFDRDMDTYRDLPVFKQSEVLLEIIETIIDGIPIEDTNISTEYDRAMYDHYSTCIMENALLIPSKIAEAHQSDIYDQKMENATLIRKAALEILKDTKGLQKCGFKVPEYLDILRNAIETFRPLFANWVAAFDPTHYIIDRWGLFNPAGVHFEDKTITGNITSDLRAILGEGEDDWDETHDDEDSQPS